MSKKITRICTRCGHVIADEGYNFCPYCGKNLEAELQSRKKKEP